MLAFICVPAWGVGFDLNDARTESLTEVLISKGLRRDRPTLFVWEAVSEDC